MTFSFAVNPDEGNQLFESYNLSSILIKMRSKQLLRKRYQAISSRRQYDGRILSKQLAEILGFMDSVIKKEFESFNLLSFTICGGEKRYRVDPQFQSAFLTLLLQERINYFELATRAVSESQKQSNASVAEQEEISFENLPIKVIKGLKIGPNYKINLKKFIIDCTHYEIPLAKYLLRISKKNQMVAILENLQKQEPITIRFQIQDHSPAKMKALINRANKSFIAYIREMSKNTEFFPQRKETVKLLRERDDPQISSPIKTSVISIDLQSKSNHSPELQDNFADRSVIQEVLRNVEADDEQIYQLLQRKQIEIAKSEISKRWHKNVAKILLPNLSLVDIENFSEYLPITQDDAHRQYIYQHSTKKTQFVMELYLKHSFEAVVKQLCEVQNYKLWNKCINQSHVKLSISSDNAYLVYLKQRSSHELFRQRDFLFLRHLCRVGSAYYLIDCSIQNLHFMPFQSILRGIIDHCITKIQPSGTNQCRLLMEIDIEYGGLLSAESKTYLALGFLKEFAALQSFISRFKGDYKNSYNLNWEICLSSEQSQPTQHLTQSREQMPSNLFNQPLEALQLDKDNDEDEFYSIQEEQEQEPVYEITKQELAQQKRKTSEISYHQEKIELDSQGLVRLPKKYLKLKHEINPVKIEPRRKKLSYDNLIVKNDFKIDKAGGLVLINAPKIAAQNSVIKYMMSTLKKNLFSGKGMLNISLPVEIFNCDSNIQRLCEALSLAPDLIQKKSCNANPLERFKNCIAFAFSNSILYFDIEKVFNPILGETFQGFIEGCPIYAEQISHHPPITSLYLIGRGYRIYGNLEAKVYLHLNSGEGVNEGFYTIQFSDGGKVLFQTCPGELLGLAVGERKFRFKGKTFIVDPKNRLFCALSFVDESGMFSKNKWEFNDQIQGEILRVTESFIRSFFESKQGKDAITPSKKEIQERLGKITGRWIDNLCIDGKEYYNVKEIPYEMIHYEFPLNSNSNYREDLLYRKFNDLARSQNEKERLQIIQRNDRKLREKYHPTSH